MDIEELTLEKLYASPGWQAVNRLGALVEMHHIFRQNFIELSNLILRFQNTKIPSRETFLEVHNHLTRYIFNFFAATTGLTDNCRKMMSLYKGTDLWDNYDKKVKDIFNNNPLVSFVKDFRNYQTHLRIQPPISYIKANEDDTEYEIVCFIEDFQKYPNEWKSLSKKYMEQCGKEINLLKICQEYFHIIDVFYFWLYEELKEIP